MNDSTIVQVFFIQIKKQRKIFLLLIITSLMGAIQQSSLPWAIRYLINYNFIPKSEFYNISICKTLISFICFFAISEIIIRSQGIFIAKALPKFRANLKVYLISKILNKNYNYFLNEMPGNIIQKINEISTSSERIIQIIIFNFLTLISSLFLTCIFLFTIHPLYAILTLIWFVIHIITTSIRLKSTLYRTQSHHKMHGFLCDNICELLSHISLIKMCFGKYFELLKITKQLFEESSLIERTQLFFEKAKMIQSFISISFILVLMSHQVVSYNHGLQSIGDFVYVFFAIVYLTNYVWFSSFQMTVFAREYGTIKNAYEILSKGERDPFYFNGRNDHFVSTDKPKLSIHKMSFLFSNRSKIIEKRSLTVNFGEKIILQGKSGVGKSTLAKILAGLHHGYTGDIFVGGKQLSSLSRNELSRLIMLVEQKSAIFNRTIRENICYSNKSYTESELESALKITCSWEFINTLDKGIDTILGEDGFSLSSGQIQRISIARALLFKPKILILDEATSCLDQETEFQIINNLINIKDQSLLVISHSKNLFSLIPKVINF